MLQPKDTDWLNGYENKTYIYVVYKRTTFESSQGGSVVMNLTSIYEVVV